jgi:hypothetical protein
MSEYVKALGLALGLNNPEKWGGKAPMATCDRCGEPLIPTGAFPAKEFVCICCGRLLGYVEPTPVVSTPEVEARQKELQDEWDRAREGGADMSGWLRDRVEHGP